MIIRESLYIIKGEREGNEGCCCEPVHLPDEWTCSSVKLISGNRLRPTYSACQIPYVVSWCTFLLNNFALTSRSADINAKSFRWNSSSILHGVGQSIIKTYIMSKAHYILYKYCMFIPFYNDYAKRFRFIFVPLHTN